MADIQELNTDNLRNVFRSKILKRIYEKGNLDLLLSNTDDNQLKINKIDEQQSKKNEETEENNAEQLNLKIKNHLSNEWRKTLARVLKYNDDYLEKKLDITRKDAIRFFINTDWPLDNVNNANVDNDIESKTKKKSKKRKQQVKSQPKNAYQELEIIPEYDPNRILVKRCQKIPLIGNRKDLDSILTNEFDIESEMYDEQQLMKLKDIIGLKPLARLNNEKIDLDRFLNYDLAEEFQERYIEHESHSLFNSDLILANESKLYKFLNSIANTLNLSAKNETSIESLNNRSFVLCIDSVKLDIQKHPLMKPEDKMVKKLQILFEKYQATISTDTKITMENLQQQIDLILKKLETINDNNKVDMFDELKMDINLLQRLLKQRDQLILDRRKSLIELLQQWSQFQSNLEKYSNKELNEIDLRLDEIENIDLEGEKEILVQLINSRIKMEQIINFIENKTEEINEKKIKNNTYLDDGRLPGEPKFNPIELILPSNFEKNNLKLNFHYSIEILIGNKIVATFDYLCLNRIYLADWHDNRNVFLVPICLDPTYLPNNEYLNNVNGGKSFLIRVQEKNLGTKLIKTIAEIPFQNLPSTKINSKLKSVKVVENFDKLYENVNDDKKWKKIEGLIEFKMYWITLPSEDCLTTINEQLFWNDKESDQIRKLDNLADVDQWLHDLHYQFDLVLFSNDTDQYHRQIELMQLLLKKKYQLISNQQIDNNKKRQMLICRNENEVINDEKAFGDDGTFCTDEEIETNKRYNMMINRNNGHINYRDYRFMPLTNTDLLLINPRTEENEKSFINILIEFIKTSCQHQKDYLNEQDFEELVTIIPIRDNSRKNNQLFIPIVTVLQRIWEQSLIFNDQTEFVMKTGKNFKDIVSLNEIVKEPTFEGISGFDFPFLNLFHLPSIRKLNPSRRDRHKEAINILDTIDRDIQVHLLIQHATNIPLKANKIDDKLDLIKCFSYVEIKLENTKQIFCTTISNGTQPTWNESFKFKTKITPSNNIFLNLFMINKNEIDPDSDSLKFEEFDITNNDNSKLERYWLGQLKIPLFLLLFVSKLEGSFNLFSPYFIHSFRSLAKSNQLLGLNLLKNRHYDNSKNDIDYTNESGKLATNVNKALLLYDKINDENHSQLGSMLDIRMSLFITTDPPIESYIFWKTNHNSFESNELVHYCEQWLQPLHNRFPQRRFVCLVNNIQLKSILAIRFLSPLKPPLFEELISLNLDGKLNERKFKSKLNKLTQKERLYISMIIRYVSLFPSLFNIRLNSIDFTSRFIDRWSKSNIWMDVIQFLTFRIGCQVEHAILLCCFLLYLNKKAYLVLGSGSLDGPTAYVIVYQSSDNSNDDNAKDNSKVTPILVDPKRGQQFFARDHHCTLISIDCIITPDNIYANIQKSTHPNLINYNLQRSNYWQPLFNNRAQYTFPNLDLSIQPPSINYGTVDMEQAKKFEIKLETYLREQFMNWRRQNIDSFTSFNRFCNQIVKTILPEMERHSILKGHHYFTGQLTEIEKKILNELNPIYDVHKIISYPINIHTCGEEVDFENLLQLIYSTNLHQTHFGTGNQVEYVITCYVHPYPCNVYSTWIYLAAMTSNSIMTNA